MANPQFKCDARTLRNALIDVLSLPHMDSEVPQCLYIDESVRARLQMMRKRHQGMYIIATTHGRMRETFNAVITAASWAATRNRRRWSLQPAGFID